MNIGWATADITPDRPVILRGQFHSRISTHVNDPLTVTAVALECGDTRAVIVSLDSVNAPEVLVTAVHDQLRPRLPELDPRCVLISGTHTHTAPALEDHLYPLPGPEALKPSECLTLTAAGVAEAVVRAWESRSPGGVAWAYGHAVIGHNRRAQYAGGMSKMYGKTDQPDFECIEGYEDHGVDLLYTFDPDGKLTGVLVNLACPSQETEGAYYVSADFWHEAREELRRRHGAGLFVLPQCSAAGDQSPHLMLAKPAEALMRQRRQVTERQEIGRRIADAVDHELPLAEADVRVDPVFAHRYAELALPVRRVTRAEYEEAARQVAELRGQTPDPADLRAVSRHHMMSRRNEGVMARYQAQDSSPTYRAPVHVLRLGDVAMASNPFELFLDYGLRIEARSPAVQTFLVQLADTIGPAYAGYLPTTRAVMARSYGAEVVDSPVGPEGGQVLVDRTLELIRGLWPDGA